MVEFGKINTLKVIKVMKSGITLDGGTLGEIFLPEKEAPAQCRVKDNREDGKIDLSLQKSGAKAADELSNKILSTLKEHGGSLGVSDKSSPEAIYRLFGVSKKRYKNAIGALYKKRMITVEEHSIRLIRKPGEKPLKNLKRGSGRAIRRKKMDK